MFLTQFILYVDLRETLTYTLSFILYLTELWQKINEFREKNWAGSFQSLKIYACPKSSISNYYTKYKSMYQKGRKIAFTHTK